MGNVINIHNTNMQIVESRLDKNGDKVMLLSYQKDDGVTRWCTYARGMIQGYWQESEETARKFYGIY